jgi:2-polyprenyl-3-methyl-5-hydroxy-6-metoxy-1,4-benzoquinol methylase
VRNTAKLRVLVATAAERTEKSTRVLKNKLSREEIRSILSVPRWDHGGYADEMAIPSYLHPNPLIRWLFWKRYDVVAQLSELNDRATALEFGCGIGMFLPTLAARTEHVFAIDLFPQYAQEVVRRLGLGSKVTFASGIDDIPDHSLDLIVAADVLEHLADPRSLVSAFRRKLRPNGRLVVSGPTESRLYKLGRILAGFGDKGDYHVTNIDRLETDIKESGYRHLQVVHLPFNFLPPLFKIHKFVDSSATNTSVDTRP